MILNPYVLLLATLIHVPESQQVAQFIFVPAIREMLGNAKSSQTFLRSKLLPYAGGLTIIQQAQISNWFYCHVPDAPKTLVLWIARPALVHAFTLVIRHQKGSEFKKTKQYLTAKDKDACLLDQAWAYQKKNVLETGADVDKECLSHLEERMFEDSEFAAAAGNRQWGLDSGTHQDDWNPYIGIPADWSRNAWVGEGEELEVRAMVFCFGAYIGSPTLRFDSAGQVLSPDITVTFTQQRQRSLKCHDHCRRLGRNQARKACQSQQLMQKLLPSRRL